MSDSEAYQDDHVPKRSEAKPLAELAYVVCKYRDNNKPVYPMRRLATTTVRGHQAKCASLKVFGIV